MTRLSAKLPRENAGLDLICRHEIQNIATSATGKHQAIITAFCGGGVLKTSFLQFHMLGNNVRHREASNSKTFVIVKNLLIDKWTQEGASLGQIQSNGVRSRMARIHVGQIERKIRPLLNQLLQKALPLDKTSLDGVNFCQAEKPRIEFNDCPQAFFHEVQDVCDLASQDLARIDVDDKTPFNLFRGLSGKEIKDLKMPPHVGLAVEHQGRRIKRNQKLDHHFGRKEPGLIQEAKNLKKFRRQSLGKNRCDFQTRLRRNREKTLELWILQTIKSVGGAEKICRAEDDLPQPHTLFGESLRDLERLTDKLFPCLWGLVISDEAPLATMLAAIQKVQIHRKIDVAEVLLGGGRHE